MSEYDIGAVLTYYGATRLPSASGWRSVRCPFHGDGTASAGVSLTEGAFRCHGCGVKGDAIGLIIARERCLFRDAIDLYAQITGAEHPRSLARKAKVKSMGFDDDGRPRGFEIGSGFGV